MRKAVEGCGLDNESGREQTEEQSGGEGPAPETSSKADGDTQDVELSYTEPSNPRKFLTWWKLQWALPWRRFSEKSVLILEVCPALLHCPSTAPELTEKKVEDAGKKAEGNGPNVL